MDIFTAIDKMAGRKTLFLLALFLLSLLFRLPTLFNDYYDVDELSAIVQTHEYMAGDVPGVDFKESKLPLYHLIFKFSYSLSPENGWGVVHFINIIIVFLTAFFIYLIGAKLYDFRTGAIASILYAVLISSFNRHFMATNGEVIFNLPLAAGLYYFIVFLKGDNLRRYSALLLSFAMGVAAVCIKLHGLIFFIFLAVFAVFYYPYYMKKMNSKYIGILCGIGSLFIIIFFIDYIYKDYFASSLLLKTETKLFYAVAKGINPFYFLYRFLYRQGMLALWHMVVWVPAFIFLINFIKNRFRSDSIEESSLVLFYVLTYLMIFAGIARLYFHYFMVPYPAMCLMASAAIGNFNTKRMAFFKEKLMILILIPSLFFLAWNTKDVIIKNFYPSAFYNEGKILYWTRAVLVGTFNDYLLPDGSYIDACEYIKKATEPGDRIFVWGDGPLLYYFSGRRMGAFNLWPKTSVIRINSLYEEGTAESISAAQKNEKNFIDVLERKGPVLLVDTSGNGLSSFNYKLTPLVEKYVKENYYFLSEVSRMKIYRRK